MRPRLLKSAETARVPWSVRAADSALARYSESDGQWHYKDGLLFKAVRDLWDRTGDARYWQELKGYADRHLDLTGSIKTFSAQEYNLDQINPGRVLFPLYRETGDQRYRRAIQLLREQLWDQPRTREGGFCHKAIYPEQMWLDGIYMSAPFYAEFAATFDEPAAFEDVALQIISIEGHTREPGSGLLCHAWDESHSQAWADPSTGRSPSFWSRAIGWYCMGIVDVLDFIPPNHASRRQLLAILEQTLKALARVQDQATGLWWQVLDQGGRRGNYLEASGTSMFIYAYAKCIRKGYIDATWKPTATRAFQGLLDHLVTLDGAGLVDLHGICTSAGLGGDPYRDGSYEYYIGEPIATNDLHGVGAFILAALEMECLADGDPAR